MHRPKGRRAKSAAVRKVLERDGKLPGMQKPGEENEVSEQIVECP